MPEIIVTSEGHQIDMDALRLKNEKTVAVGNMRVNARGDELDPITGAILRPRSERMKDYYKLNTVVPKDEPVRRSHKQATDAPVLKKEATPTASKPEPKIEKVKDVAIDPATWVDTPPLTAKPTPAPQPVIESTTDEVPAGAIREVSRRETAAGIEVEFSDGSIEVFEKPGGGITRL